MNKFKYIIFFLFCAIILGFTYRNATNNKADRIYFSITDFSFSPDGSFTIGENSDLCFKGVPHDYMTVSYDKEQKKYSLKIDSQHEKCMYYKVNGDNPNLHLLNTTSKIKFNNKEYTYQDIQTLIQHTENEYYMLTDLLPMLDKNWINSDLSKAVNSGKASVSTFIYKPEPKIDEYKLCILDDYIVLTDSSAVAHKYISEIELPANEHFSIQFFKMRNWSTMASDSDYLHDSERNYYAKPVQIFTEWGAGQLKVSCNDPKGRIHKVNFPKAITTTIFVDDIQKKLKESEGGVYLKQLLNTYPLPTDFYIPPFSNALSEYVCELKACDDSVSIVFQEGKGRTEPIRLDSDMHISSCIPNVDQDLEKGSITYKSRVLNGKYYLSAYWLLLILWAGLSIILYFVLPKGPKNHVNQNRFYILMMFTLFYFYLNQKLFLAEKLTFTYPYFEKILPVTSLTVLLSLGSLFLLVLLLNKPHIVDKDTLMYNTILQCKSRKGVNVRKKISNILFRIVSLLYIYAIIFVAIVCFSDHITPIWSSYDSSLLSLLNVLEWNDIPVLNDNHFTVVMMVGLLFLFLSFLFMLYNTKIYGTMDKKIRTFVDYLEQKVWICVIVAVLGAIVCLVAGNFGTSIAVLSMVFALTVFFKWAMNRKDWNLFGVNISITLQYLIVYVISCLFVIIGVVGDFGYFTNVFGIVLTCSVLLYVVANEYQDTSSRKNGYLYFAIIIGFVIVSSLLFCGVQGLNPEEVDYGRGSRRVNISLNEKKVREAGYSYTESDMQWMDLMHYYAEKPLTSVSEVPDIYAEENGFHSLISSGSLSPVVLNDVCVPAAYLGPLRLKGLFLLMFGVLVMLVLSYWYNVMAKYPELGNKIKPYRRSDFDRQRIGRLLASFLWFGVTMYIYMSYSLAIPFTGRLIPGFGVDAVGEALEILVLFAFMCNLSPYKK